MASINLDHENEENDEIEGVMVKKKAVLDLSDI